MRYTNLMRVYDIRALVHMRGSQGVCPPRTGTKLRQKKKEIANRTAMRSGDAEERQKRRQAEERRRGEGQERGGRRGEGGRGGGGEGGGRGGGEEKEPMRMHSLCDTHRSIIR